MLTTAALGRPKGEARVTWDLLAEHAGGLHCLTGGEEGPLARELAAGWDRPGPRARWSASPSLSGPGPRRASAPPPARGGAPQPGPDRSRPPAPAPPRRHQRRALRPARGQAAPRRPDLHPPSHDPGRGRPPPRLPPRAAPEERRRDGPPLRATCPRPSTASAELADRLDFTLADLGYRFPEYPLPPGETPSSFLRHITWNGASARFRPLTAKAQAQIQKELDLIEKLDLAGYFLIVWDIVQLLPAREHPGPGPRLGRQQRGLLRPLDHGRGSGQDGPPLRALPLRGARRVAGHRSRPSLGRPARAGHPVRLPALRRARRGHDRQRHHLPRPLRDPRGGQGLRLLARSRSTSSPSSSARWSYDVASAAGDTKSFARGAGRRRVRPRRAARSKHFAELWTRIHNLPRHLGQHSGGMVIAAGRLDEVVPLEPASMPGRVVVQWDKDDCADLGIIKVDLLGLGMLDALEEMVPHHPHPRRDPRRPRPPAAGRSQGLPHAPAGRHGGRLPGGEPGADGLAAAQPSRRGSTTSSSRSGIIRPGPIVGNMASPYFERRNGRQPVVYPHPSLEPILERTLGVPIFQEQLLRVAMVAAGFTGGEAEELRRAMGSKRSVERMNAIVDKLRRGMTERRDRRQGAGRDRPGASPPSRSTASPSRTPRASP